MMIRFLTSRESFPGIRRVAITGMSLNHMVQVHWGLDSVNGSVWYVLFCVLAPSFSVICEVLRAAACDCGSCTIATKHLPETT